MVTAGTPFVTEPKPPTLAASPLVVVIFVPLMLYDEPILSAEVAALKLSNFTLDVIVL